MKAISNFFLASMLGAASLQSFSNNPLIHTDSVMRIPYSKTKKTGLPFTDENDYIYSEGIDSTSIKHKTHKNGHRVYKHGIIIHK